MKKLFIYILISTLCYITSAQVPLTCDIKSNFVSQWKHIGPFVYPHETDKQHFGAISAISVNPNDPMEIYIGAYTSGLFYTSNRGLTWQCLTDSFIYPVIGVNSIYVDYSKTPYTILIATGKPTLCDGAEFGILKSIDGGSTWKITYKEDDNLFVSRGVNNITYAPKTKMFYAYTTNSVLRSDDMGESWKEIFSLKNIPDVIYNKDFEIISMVISSDENKIFFSTKAQTFLHQQSKKTLMECDVICIENCNKKTSQIKYKKLTDLFKNRYSPSPENYTFAFKLCKANTQDKHFYVDRTYTLSFEHSIYIYDENKNEIVSHVSPNNNNLKEDIYWRYGLIVHPTIQNVMYMAGDIFYKSEDSGKNFIPMYAYSFGDNNVPHADIRAAFIYRASIDGKNDYIYLGTDGGLSFTNNSGRNFINLNGERLPITQFYGLDVSPYTGVVSGGTQDNSIMSFLPKENKWIISIRGDGYDVEYSKNKKGEAYGQYNSRWMCKTINDVAPFSFPMNIEPKERAGNKKTIVTHRNGNVYFAETELHIKYNGKETWNTYTLPGEMQEILSLVVSNDNPNTIYLSRAWNSLYKSIDGGKTFENISEKVNINGSNKSNTRIHAICVHPHDENKIWISLGYLGNYSDACHKTDRILYSEDGGNNWIDYSEGLPVYNVSDIVFWEGTQEALFAATINGIYFRENKNTPWQLFSTHLPKCVIPEIKINYCKGTLLAATLGRGIWETPLPDFDKRVPILLKNKNYWNDTTSDIFITEIIELDKNATLYIDVPIHIAAKCEIRVKSKNQVVFGKKGKLINECVDMDLEKIIIIK